MLNNKIVTFQQNHATFEIRHQFDINQIIEIGIEMKVETWRTKI